MKSISKGESQANDINPQIPREINIASIFDSQMVRKNLQGDNIQQSLQAIDSFRDTDRLAVGRNGIITLITEDDRLRLARGDLSIRGLYFRVKRILSHDNYDGHVLINKGERAVLQFASKDTYQDNSAMNRSV
jgi:hypothetical protein